MEREDWHGLSGEEVLRALGSDWQGLNQNEVMRQLQQCVRTISGTARREKINLKVMDIIELVLQAM